ncbi:O-methyltransferase [Virgisporangium aliadipatigenens]|uniref:O-methyltransferase n=1 Tax=Virgisporangium aliadipatigenens TaxID=741659 RepID=A0A8J3YUW5_9ACTN|nr:O-methyltransferase [Virgisporangium aliadipatigenens]GIJ51107.1 O-methyltransferase [Virgisporangium aliadipatigenens]
MSNRTLGLDEELHAYVVAHGSRPDPVASDLIDETHAVLPDEAEMQIAPEQAALITMLTKLVDARLAVEVGTFTGFSSLAIARGLAADGRLICFDVSDEYTSIARRYWARAGVADRVELRIGPAAEGLAALPATREIDLAFIDADKRSYPTYWAELVPRMRVGGLILVDNVLREGRVIDPQDDSDRVIIEFNRAVVADPRVEAVLVPIADGVTVARVVA